MYITSPLGLITGVSLCFVVRPTLSKKSISMDATNTTQLRMRKLTLSPTLKRNADVPYRWADRGKFFVSQVCYNDRFSNIDIYLQDNNYVVFCPIYYRRDYTSLAEMFSRIDSFTLEPKNLTDSFLETHGLIYFHESMVRIRTEHVIKRF